MKKAQLNAIRRAYTAKRRAATEQEAKRLGVDSLFCYQSKYKTLNGFVNGIQSAKNAKLLSEIGENVNERIEQLTACGCTSEKMAEAQKALQQYDRLTNRGGL